MKATELMIGDWVQTVAIDKDTKKEKTAIGRVVEITPYFDHIGIATDDEDAKRIFGIGRQQCSIRPTPLTYEILKKNGFLQNNGHMVMYVHINEFNGYAIQLDADDYGWHLTDNRFVDIDNVHDLQHLLRLCGVEKEVVL